MRWIVKRAIIALLTIWTAFTITFVLIRLMPGNFIEMMILYYMNTYGYSEEEAKELVYALYNVNLDEPIWKQYLDFITNLLQGNWGVTYCSRAPVLDCLLYALPWTVFLLSISMTISFVIGIGLGMFMAYRRGGLFDGACSVISSISSAIPNFILGLLLLYFLAIQYPLFPARGSYDITIEPGFTLEYVSSVLYHAFLPMMAYVLTSFGGWALAMRGSTIRVLGEDYVIAAEARGLKSRRITWTYVGRNAILPLFTSFAISLGYMFGGSVFIESYFAYTGVGQVIGLALSFRDYPLIQGGFLLIITAVVVSNFIAELLYGVLDPRIRRGGGYE
ncbi:MAG: ABC transporter permease [Thermoprotei archaeon]|nr:MAG: ABC transporter permease [Thermoprotei archaeon]